MNKKLIAVFVGVSIVIIMLANVLMPVINDAVDDTKIYYNNNTGSYSMINDGADIDFSIVPTGSTSGAIHNVVIEGGSNTAVYSGLRCIVMSDKFVISQLNTAALGLAYVIDDMQHYVTFESGNTITVSLSNNVAVVSNGTDNYTIPFDWCFYVDSSSKSYRMMDYTSDNRVVYINDVNQVYASNWINTTGEFFAINGTNVTIYGENENTTASYDGLTEVMNGVSSFTVGPISGGARTTGIHFSVLNGSADYEVYPYFILVPASVYGQTETNEQASAILYAVPALFAVALLVAVVGLFTRRD